MRNRLRNEEVKPQPLRPVFEDNDLSQAISIQLVPHLVKMAIVDPGTGPTPKVGQFVRVKQFIYLFDKMVNIRQEHITYTFGRNKLIKGLEYCLSLCRQGFKGRLHLDSTFAYAHLQLPQIPPHSTLVIDMEVNNITSEPITMGQYEDQLLIAQIIGKAKDGDGYARSGDYIEAQRHYQSAFSSIQSQRCKDIRGYLYSKAKTNYVMNNSKKTQQQISKEIAEVAEMYKIFDMIKIKSIELALINKDYYKVLFLSKQCMLQNRIESHQRVLAPRATAFAQVGEFQSAKKLMKHLHDLYPTNAAYESELKRIEERQRKYSRHMGKLQGEAILAITQPNKKRKKRRERTEFHYEEDADDEDMRAMAIEEQGLHLKFKHLDYFQ